MSIPTKDRNLLYIDSGGICAFPDCPQRLVESETDVDEATILGEAAHIVAESVQGPRGKEVINEEDRNKHTNLILLCRKHHKIIDSQPRTYSVAVLRQMKAEHQKRIQTALQKKEYSSTELVHERIQSTLLPITHLPQVLFSAPCSFDQSEIDEVKKR
ncbi:MAG: HNH endonuclease, partial [Aridibacter sp.]